MQEKNSMLWNASEMGGGGIEIDDCDGGILSVVVDRGWQICFRRFWQVRKSPIGPKPWVRGYYLRKRTEPKFWDFVDASGSKKFTQIQFFNKFGRF